MSRSRLLNPAWITLLLCACIVLVPAAGFSEDWAGLSKQLKDRCAEFNQDVKDLSLSMEMTTPSSKGDVTTQMAVFKHGEKYRAELQMQEMPGGGEMPPGMAGMTIIVINDGKSTWTINSMTGKMQLPEEEAEKYQGQWDCEDFIPQEAEIAGSETVSGRDCHVLVVKDETSPYAKLWIDKKTLDSVKIEAKPQDGKISTALFSDFKKLDGDWQFPYKTQMYQDKTLLSTMIVKSVAVNKGLSDDLFNPDKADAKGPSMTDMMKTQKKEEGKQE